jgi:hypothetical protein
VIKTCDEGLVQATAYRLDTAVDVTAEGGL